MTNRPPSVDLSSKTPWLLGMLPWLILLLGIVFALSNWHNSRNKLVQQQQIEFALLFDRLILSIEGQLKANEQVLRGVSGLFYASDNIERAEFQSYVSALKLEELYPGILGVGFSKLIDPQSLAAHIKAVRAEGFPDYTVNPAGIRDTYTAIVYLEPFDWRNQRAFGYDMYSDPIRNTAMRRAAETGAAALSGKVTLMQEVDKDMQAGVLLYVPIYQSSASNQKNNKLIGWTYSPLRMKDMMIRMLARDQPDLAGRLAISIHDGSGLDPNSLLFETTTPTSTGAEAMHLKRQIVLAGQVWTVSASSLPEFADNSFTKENHTLAAGLLITTLLAILLGTLARGHTRMASAALALRQFKAIIDSTGDAIISETLTGKITSWNHAAYRIFGYTAEEVIGQSIRLLAPPERDNEESEILKRISRGERVNHFETVRQHKDGHWIDISASISPLINDSGEVVGASKIARDISEHKRAENRLKESEERLALATTHNGVGIWDWDLQTLQMIWDDSMFALYQMRREDFSGVVEAWKTALHADDSARAEQEIQAALAGEKPLDTEFRVIVRNGEIRHIKAVAKVFRDQNGKALRMLGTNIDITERKLAEDKLRTSEQQLRMVLEGAELGYWDWNIVTGKVERNQQWAKILGYSYAEIQQTTQQWSDFVHPDDRERAWESVFAAIKGESAAHKLEYRMLHKDGSVRWILDQAKVMQRSADGKATRMSGTHSDISERKQAEIKLQLAAKVFMHAHEGILICDAAGNIIEVNDTFSHVSGYSREELLGQQPRMLKSGRHTSEFYAEIWESLHDKGYWSGEIWNRRKSGEVSPELVTISAVRDMSANIQNYLALFSDISSIKQYQLALEHIAHYDPLTGLPNRVLLADRLQQIMLQSDRRKQSLALLFIDLDGFKAINDSKGHQVGDELLIAVSRRMKEALREGDTLARIGGDEFVALLADLESISDCEPLLNRLLLAAAQPVTVGDAVLRVSASIGITLYPHDKSNADQLMRHADEAMYQAKQAGKNCFQLYDFAENTAPANNT